MSMRGLTDEQKKKREGKLTASRIACLMTGDATKIYQLWLEMTGRTQEPDLSDVWAVQLGLATEVLNLDWAERKVGDLVTNRGYFIQHPKYDWAGCTLDGRFFEKGIPIEAKHCGGYESLETIIDRYQPQMQWTMECLQAEECALSVIFGAREPVIEWIPRDDEYAAEMIRRGEQFMEHVRNRTLPVDLPPIPAPVIPIRSYDMTGRNEWANHAAVYLETHDAAAAFQCAGKSLKELVPDDARNAFGHGVIVKRDRCGRLSINPYSERGAS